jgi:transcriptional regulator of acetoin/glycerol metabolism
MADPTTAAMQAYGANASPDNPRGTRAGLVLLYAPKFHEFEPCYLLNERDLVIGRDPSSGICIPENAVSRQHANIRFEKDHWVVSDLGSRNGTLVDGEFVSSLALEDLHEIRVGDAIFKFVAQGAESYALYRIDGFEVSPSALKIPLGLEGAVFGGFQVRQQLRALDRVAKSEISVIISGESGTGKEIFARGLHEASGRRGAFVAMNCAAIPSTLLESELFGYKRGAFSGAERDKVGLVKAADHGTLFLDEIGDMPVEAQAKLLRVIQTKEIVPLGATIAERVDVRIVCATHRDLAVLQLAEKFRGDLYARLNEYSLRLPPLRERKEDIYALVKGLLARHGRPHLEVAFPFMTGLLHYDWPYNVRELEAAIKRGVAFVDGAALDADHLPDVIKTLMKEYGKRTKAASGAKSETTGETAEPLSRRGPPTAEELRALLVEHKGNVAAVGRQFGKERMQVHRWMKRFGINVEEYR